MRTTIVIDDSLDRKMRPLVSKRGLSEFINRCLREHFEKEERTRRLREMEQSYARAAKGKGRVSEEFNVADTEEWPEW